VKLLCVIDHFGSGGAQRQMVTLACGLAGRGHQVDMFTYHPHHTFFLPAVEAAGLEVHGVDRTHRGIAGVTWDLARLLRRKRYDGVIAFLGAPSACAELARLLAPHTRLVVSERSSHAGDASKLDAWGKRLLHGLADVVVANSRAHASWLLRHRWLRHKTRTIYNGYDLGPEPASPTPPGPHSLSLLVVGRVGPEKNGANLARALVTFRERRGWVPKLSWAGRPDETGAGRGYRKEIETVLSSTPEVQAAWTWLGERSDVPALLDEHHALVLPSRYEGLPNAVCEALIAARPVLASCIGDMPHLVAEGERGFLFDPMKPGDIATAIERLVDLPPSEWEAFGRNARAWARANLQQAVMVEAYERALLRGT
jgi:glycosyltransferase involved in cell wall biosynthesis